MIEKDFRKDSGIDKRKYEIDCSWKDIEEDGQDKHSCGGGGCSDEEVDEHWELKNGEDDKILERLGKKCCEIGIASVEVSIWDFVYLLTSLFGLSHH